MISPVYLKSLILLVKYRPSLDTLTTTILLEPCTSDPGFDAILSKHTICMLLWIQRKQIHLQTFSRPFRFRSTRRRGVDVLTRGRPSGGTELVVCTLILIRMTEAVPVPSECHHAATKQSRSGNTENTNEVVIHQRLLSKASNTGWI